MHRSRQNAALARSAAAFHAPFVAKVSRSCNVRRREDIGAVVVALISNAASHSTAVLVPMKNKLDLASGVALGSNGVARRGTVAVRQLPWHAFDLFLRRWKWAVTISILSVKFVSKHGKSHRWQA
jgi:hypothetical protein